MNSFPKRRSWRLFGAITYLSVLSGPAFGIDPHWLMSQYTRDRWGTEDGFPRGQVHAITQTADGYLWIGTDAGLVRFDGLRFEIMQDEGARAPVTNVLGLTSDNEGSLWIRVEGEEGLLRYREGAFQHLSSTYAGTYLPAAAIGRTRAGEFLAAHNTEGALLYRLGKFQSVFSTTPLPRSPVLAIAQSGDGDIWMGTRDAGLVRLRRGQSSVITAGIPDAKVNCLLPDESGGLWVGTDDGIARWDGSGFTPGGMPASANHFQALAITKDRDANLWIGTDSRGILRLNAEGLSSLNPSLQAVSDPITALFEDREGNVWAGSANSIERLRDSAFLTYSVAEGMPSSSNGPLHVDFQNRVWFAPKDGGLYWLANGKVRRVTGAGLEKDVIYSITSSPEELWIGRQRGGLTRLRFSGPSIITKTFTTADGLAQNSVFAVHRNRDGTIWAGTLSGGVSVLRKNRFATFSTRDGLASDAVFSIAESADGTTWVATRKGLSAFAHGLWRSYRKADGLPSENVSCLLQDREDVLWIGTDRGLAYARSGDVHRIENAPDVLKEQILGLAQDRSGYLWISTSNHVMRVRRDKLAQGTAAVSDINQYGTTDGLQGSAGVKRHQSVDSDIEGRVWFSLDRGLSVVDSARAIRGSAPVIAHVETVRADGLTLKRDRTIRVPSGKERIAFEFTGMGLAVPEAIRFRYALDGYDSQWSEPTAAREATYTNLGPGTYRFRVIAGEKERVWSSPEAAITFEIEPSFWQTAWFRALAGVACALIALAGYRLRLHHLTGQLNVRFEERLAERSRIAQELHDTLLQGLLSASMQLHVVSDSLPASSPFMPRVKRVLELMGQVIDEGRNAVRGLRSSTSASLDLEQAFSRIREELAIDDAVDFRIVVDGQPKPLHPLLRDECYRIGREALVNAFLHARATRVEAEISYSPGLFRILVSDNGCGIDPQVLEAGRDGHWGLRGMRERAERIGAHLHVRSSATAGTEVEISVPGHMAFLNHPSSKWKRLVQLARGGWNGR